MNGAHLADEESIPSDTPDSRHAESSDMAKKTSRRLKLIELSAELMRLPKARKEARAASIGLVEEARNRRNGRKEHYVYWDRVEINGKELPSQRADVSILSAASGSHEATDGIMNGSPKMGSIYTVDEAGPSYLLVGHSTCDLCLMTFEASSVSGVVTTKRILEVRRDWGMPSEGKLDVAASNLYDPARLCVLCSQFFCPAKDGTGETALIPCGVGRSDERVSLTLESMASNKPLPGRTPKTTTVDQRPRSRTGQRRHQRGRPDGCVQIPPQMIHGANFRLDELIENDSSNVEETDLAKQPGAIAAQSSTADDMGANVCLRSSESQYSRPSAFLPGTPFLPGSKADKLSILPIDSPSYDETSTANVEKRGKWDARMVTARRTSPRSRLRRTSATHLCSRTRRERQPWWEVNLGSVFPIRFVRIHHPNRRMEVTRSGTSLVVNVAPFWIMTAARPIGDAAPEKAREMAIACERVSSHRRVSVWDLGANHFASVVRVQAEGVKSLQLSRVEVIKGGGTRQAMDLVRHQCFARESDPFNQVDSSGLGGGKSPSRIPLRAKSPRASEHTNMMRRLQGYYAERRAGTSSVSDPVAIKEQAPRSSGVTRSVFSSTTGPAGAGGVISTSTAVATVTVPAVDGAEEPGATPRKISAGNAGVIALPQADGPSRSLSTRGRSAGSSRRSRSPERESEGEDVQRLLLRAMVGYDWVDDFNVQELKVRGAFTERDVEVLKDIFIHCALGDDVDSRASTSVSDPCMHLDPADLCGELRRLQLQVQTSSSNKGKPPMLLAVRESSNMLQLLSSGVVETLQDAFARAEAQLLAEQRPLSLDWAHFLGAMALCLDGALQGAGAVSSTALVRLFEEAQDDRLDFLTRRRDHPPGLRRDTAPEGLPGASSRAELSKGLPRRAQTSQACMRRSDRALGARAEEQKSAGWGWWTSSGATEEVSTREEASIGTREDMLDGKPISRVGTWQRKRAHESTTTRRSPRRQGSCCEARKDTASPTGGSSDALESLMRPQGKHEVWRGYRESVVKRKERQREAMLRAADPDIVPTRAYKPCGLCQAFFPAESLFTTASLKVLGTFLTKAGAPNERFERKASRLCALHRLPLCVFCSQFFDPDLPKGIIFPDGRAFGGPGRRYDGSPSSPRGGNNLVPFFDDRFPDRWGDTPSPASNPGLASLTPGSHALKKSGIGPRLVPRSSSRTQLVPHGSHGGSGVRLGVGRRSKARELREAGRLMRSGFSIRDHLDPEKS